MAEFGCCFCAGAIRDENAPEVVEIAVRWSRPLDAEADLAGLLPEGIASLTWWDDSLDLLLRSCRREREARASRAPVHLSFRKSPVVSVRRAQ